MDELATLRKRRLELEALERTRKQIQIEKAKIRELEMNPVNKKVRNVLLGIGQGVQNVIREQAKKKKNISKRRRDSDDGIPNFMR